LVAGLCLGSWLPGFAATPPAKAKSGDADSIIAAYLVNFLRYVEWPESVPPAGEPWRIGVVKSDVLAELLKRLTSGKIVRGRPIAIVNADNLGGLRDCQIVLLADLPAGDASVTKALVERPVLTVVYRGKTPVEVAAVIELVLQNRNIRYRLNPELLAARGLRATPGLLENALPVAGNPVRQTQ